MHNQKPVASTHTLPRAGKGYQACDRYLQHGGVRREKKPVQAMAMKKLLEGGACCVGLWHCVSVLLGGEFV